MLNRTIPATVLVVIIIVCYLFSGCAHTIYRIEPNTVNILDDWVKSKVEVGNIGSRRTDTNTLEVWAVLHNRSEQSFFVTARANFFDPYDRPLETTGWSTFHLDPDGVVTVSLFSTKTDIGYYYIEVREGQ